MNTHERCRFFVVLRAPSRLTFSCVFSIVLRPRRREVHLISLRTRLGKL